MATFRPDRTGGANYIITRAMVSDGEAKTEAREGKGEPCSAGHGERHSDEVSARATAMEMAKGPYLRLVWLSEDIDEVREMLAEQCEG